MFELNCAHNLLKRSADTLTKNIMRLQIHQLSLRCKLFAPLFQPPLSRRLVMPAHQHSRYIGAQTTPETCQYCTLAHSLRERYFPPNTAAHTEDCTQRKAWMLPAACKFFACLPDQLAALITSFISTPSTDCQVDTMSVPRSMSICWDVPGRTLLSSPLLHVHLLPWYHLNHWPAQGKRHPHYNWFII